LAFDASRLQACPKLEQTRPLLLAAIREKVRHKRSDRFLPDIGPYCVAHDRIDPELRRRPIIGARTNVHSHGAAREGEEREFVRHSKFFCGVARSAFSAS
jgi:hypothetical protein